MKKIFSLVICLLFVQNIMAQIIADPTTWTYKAEKTKANEYDLHIKLALKPHWHIWSLQAGGDGMQMSPEYKFDKNANVEYVGKIKEVGKKLTKKFEGIDGEPNNYFENNVEYVQHVKVKNNTTITGTHMYQVCDDKGCLPPKDKKISIAITDIEAVKNADTVNVKPIAVTPIADTNHNKDGKESIVKTPTDTTTNTTSTANSIAVPSNTDSTSQALKTASKSLPNIWVTGFGWGLASVLTPCVFAMLPMTIGFFLKRSKTPAEGKKNALMYAFFIVAILTILGALISAIGGNTLNNISTNWIVNIFFFIVFMVFGISFLGAFEITLPSSWSTLTDSKANTSSMLGIFFMALTLVIVSFSCTGPFLGNMLVESTKGGKIGPVMGFNGFAVGMALPFALFAFFPNLLQKINKQGGWLNAVKVTFGIVEIALAFKFLSNADLAQGWRLLDREIFIAIWFILALILGLYLLGFLRFHHDSEMPKNDWGLQYLTVTRLFFAITVLAFGIYLLPGMWGAPLKGISAFVPPMGTFENFGNSTSSNIEKTENANIKYADKMKIYEPEIVTKYGLVTYFDYKQAIAESKKQNKPLFLDFTGINCVNCRKMEAQVWSNPEVMKRLKENFVVASLYADMDAIVLPANEQYPSTYLGTTVKTLGDYNEDIQASKYNANSQPYYFFIDDKETKLADAGYGYDPNVQKFIRHLDAVVAKYKSLHK